MLAHRPLSHFQETAAVGLFVLKQKALTGQPVSACGKEGWGCRLYAGVTKINVRITQ